MLHKFRTVKDLKYFAIANDLRELTTIMGIELRGEDIDEQLETQKMHLIKKLKEEDKMASIILGKLGKAPSLRELNDSLTSIKA